MPAIGSSIELLKPAPPGCEEIVSTGAPDFLPETKAVREREWTVAAVRPDLRDRRVEITGPVDRKMIINALNSGANVFMADFEDANSPTWENNVTGQRNVRDAVAGTISYASPEGKRYTLAPVTALLMVRPRGWHLVEKHLRVQGEPISASLFDFGLAFYHNATALIARGTGPYFYLPKLESHLEARLWNDVFTYAQDALGIPRGTIRATVLIETILAAFETDEILWELKDHAAGLNCGRCDYIFSYIKKLRRRPERVLPDRARVTMEQPFLRSYADLVIRTCHRRGIHALGGMAAQIPIKRDPALNAQLSGPNQIARRRDDVRVTAADLLAAPPGAITHHGLRTNLDVALRYLAAWLGGLGCVPIDDLMEDAATAEICRAQLWQWLQHGARLEDGRRVDAALLQQTLAELVASLPERVGATDVGREHISLAARLLSELTTGAEFAEFLTSVAYDHLD